jgi:hypothetical protein
MIMVKKYANKETTTAAYSEKKQRAPNPAA